MKTKLSSIIIIAAALAFSAASAFAQSNFSESVSMHRRDMSQALGRDFWFAPAQNNLSGSGKYISIYIASPTGATAFVDLQGTLKSISVPAYGIASFSIPSGLEMQSSGDVENKAIHVYSTDGDIAVCLLTHASSSGAGGDGMYCIPTAGWGEEYVVASFGSLFEGSGSYNYDYPSEFTITSDQDNTSVQITPSTDLRQADVFPANNTVIAYPRGKTFSVTLDRGQCIQYQAVLATDADNYDVTGTIIHANNPVGVIGASMGTNIPSDVPYSNYVTDMIPPVRTWGETYYATNFASTNGTAMYLFISSVPNQVIHRYNSTSGDNVEAQLGAAFEPYFTEEQSANKFYSSSPFLLVQYMINGSGSGSPSEVVIPARENYGKNAILLTPGAGAVQFADYANIFVNINDEGNVTFDGKKITSYTHQPIDNIYEVYLIPNLSGNESHLVTSDSGVGAYVYGYGASEPFAWGASSLMWNSNSPDTTPPAISFTQNTLCIQVAISDTGSGLAEIILDSTDNLSFSVDSGFVPGSGDRTTSANFCVTDSMQTGYMQFTAYDLAGNKSVGTITFTPSKVVVTPKPGFIAQSTFGFDTVLVGTSKTLGIFLVIDTSQTLPITIDSLWTDNTAFTINKSLQTNPLPDTIAPGATDTFFVTFSPLAVKSYTGNAYAHSTGLTPRSGPLTGIGYSVAGVADEPRTEVRVTLTPNPAAKSVSLNFSLSQTANVTFELSSMDGRKVFNWNANAQSEGQHVETLDLSTLAHGDYIYRFAANGEVTSGKLAIIH